MSGAQPEDQLTLLVREAEHLLGKPRREVLSKHGGDRHRDRDDDGHESPEDHTDIHDHPDTDQEERNEERIADELGPVHQG